MAVFTILFDNYTADSRLHSNWGFSCLVEVSGRLLLFDTGSGSDALFYNTHKLGVDLSVIEAIAISHNHWDHVGGLGDILDNLPGTALYIPASFPERFRRAARRQMAEVKDVTEPVEILPGAVSLGEMGDDIVEQSLLISTDSGGVLLTGCAHPGVLDIVDRAIDYASSPPYMILGGLHLKGKSERILQKIIGGIKDRGIAVAAPSHCTGDRAREVFEEAFGDGFAEVGAGSVIEV